MIKVTVKNIRGFFNEKGEIYLYLKDVVYGLEFVNTQRTMNGLQYTMDRDKVLSYLRELGVDYKRIVENYISEEIFYRLAALAIKNEKTDNFKNLICNDVIPRIRRIWAFEIRNENNDDLILAKALLISNKMIKNLNKKVKGLENYKENEILCFDSEEDYETFLKVNKQFFSMKQIAKDFNISEEKLKDFLQDEGLIFIFKPNWIISRKFENDNLIIRKRINIKNLQERRELFWTLKGREKIKRILKKYSYTDK